MAQLEQHARHTIDQLLGAAGWQTYDPDDVHTTARRRVANLAKLSVEMFEAYRGLVCAPASVRLVFLCNRRISS